MIELTPETRDRVETLLSDHVVRVAPVLRGYTAAKRWRLWLGSGTSVFVKLATTHHTAAWLRAEWRVYSELSGRFMARAIAWQDHPEQPLLVLEDLSQALWPPPWDGSLVRDVRQTLVEIHASRAALQRFSDVHGDLGGGWGRVAEDPAPFLALGLATEDWLATALPALMQASDCCSLDGDEVIHLDVRSDNLCRTDRGIVLVDWSWACLGNGALDTGFWLPSLHAEGGPAPHEMLPGRADVAARVSGFFAGRAGLPDIPDAPHVRQLQRRQLEPALLWASRELGLPRASPA